MARTGMGVSGGPEPDDVRPQGFLGFSRASWLAFALLAAILLYTRAPLYPQQLLSFDDINFAYAIGDFDIRVSQPQPPGYPLFVLETRILHHVFRVKRAESNFLILSMLSSLAILWLTMRAGERMLAPRAGMIAAALLILHPTFWYTGLTSPIRLQLGVVSLIVALTCWRVWNGEARMLYWSALALGLGAGVRPELGPVLLPLWIACALRTPATWRQRWIAAGILIGSVFAWLVPAALASGGFERFFTHSWLYMRGQSQQVKAGILGSDGSQWLQAVGWLGAWAFQDLAWWPLFTPLAWRAGDGFGLGRSRSAFFALLLVPMLAFAAVVHVADPGHVMHILPVFCLLGGHMIARAAERLGDFPGASMTVFSTSSLVLAAYIFLSFVDSRFFWRDSDWTGAAVWAATWAGALLAIHVRTATRRQASNLAMAGILAPVLMFHFWAFHHANFTYQMRSYTGWHGTWEKFRSYVQDAFQMSRVHGIWRIANTDHYALQATAELARDKPGNAWLLWHGGDSPWRKAAYYNPGLPILVLTERTSDGAPVVQLIKGNKMERQMIGADSVAEIPAGSRLIVWSDHRTPAFRDVSGALPLQQKDSVYFVDLPGAPGEYRIGKYRLRWR